MAKRKVHLIFPKELIKEPVIYRMAKQYDVIPNIRRARVTDDVGEVVLELEGSTESLEKGIDYLNKLGVNVESVVGDVME